MILSCLLNLINNVEINYTHSVYTDLYNKMI